LSKGDLLIAIFWMIFGIIITTVSYGLGLGNLTTPGSGLMPFALGIILSLCSFPILTRYFVNRKKTDKGGQQRVWSEVSFRKIALVLACLIGYSLLLERLGFLVITFFLLLVLFKMVDSQKWSWTLIATILTTSFAYFLFVVLLNVYMPTFPLSSLSGR